MILTNATNGAVNKNFTVYSFDTFISIDII